MTLAPSPPTRPLLAPACAAIHTHTWAIALSLILHGLSTPAHAATDFSTPAAIQREAEHTFNQAQQALREQNWLHAELLLERTLMLAPQHAGALLELALLLAQRDRRDSAIALIQALIHDPATPLEHRQRLQALLTPPQPGPRPATATAHPTTQLSAALAYNTNPLNASHASHLTLTQPSGDITLPLRSNRHPAASAHLRLYHRTAAGQEIQIATQAPRTSHQPSDTRPTWQLALAQPLHSLWPTAAAAHPTLGPLLPSHSAISSQRTLDGTTRHTLGLHWHPNTTPPSAAATSPACPTQTRYHLYAYQETPTAPANTHRHGWGLRLQHPLYPSAANTANCRPHWVWAEYEHPHTTAKAATLPPSLRLGWQSTWQLPPLPGTTTAWQLHTQIQSQNDTHGYTPLLRHNAPRRSLTTHIQLQRPLLHTTQHGQLTLALYWARRYSNIPLFAWQDMGLTLQWEKRWP